MGRAALAVVLLLAAAAASGAPRDDLHLRSRLLLRDIRVQSTASAKDVPRLRAQLNALKAENGDAPDDRVTEQLKTAEAHLALIEAGSTLPPPLPAESVSDEDLRDAVAQPPAPPPPPAPRLQEAAPAVAPETAAPVFDGSLRRSGLTSPAVQTPPNDPEANLDRVLELREEAAQKTFLVAASAGLLEKLHEPDISGARATFLGTGLHFAIARHPKRSSFLSVRVAARKDKRLHLIYRSRDGGAVDEDLGSLDQWSRLRGDGSGGGKPRKKPKKGAKAGAGDDGDDEGGGGGGSKHGRKGRGRKGHAGGGGGGGDDGGGDGGGAGRGGGGKSGASHHAKALRAAGGGGGGMFDGGGDGGDAGPGGGDAGSGGLFSGKGPRGRGRRKGRGSASGAGGDAGGDSGSEGSSSFARGRAHAGAGGSLSADASGASSSRSRSKSAFVPLPKDFTTRGGGSRLRGEGGEGGSGPNGSGLGGFHMSPLGKREFHRESPSAANSAAPGAPAAPAQVLAGVAAAASSAFTGGSGAAPALAVPPVRDEELRDAVAGHATTSPAAAVPSSSPSPLAPAEPAPAGSSPLLAACLCAASIGLGAYAFRRLRRSPA